MKLYVISGGPCSGKTSVIMELKKRGKMVLEEPARFIAENDKRFAGKSIKNINHFEFHNAILDFQVKQMNELELKKGVFFLDRGFVDTLAYASFHGLKIPKEKLKYIKSFKYEKIFILSSLDFYEQDKLRKETKKEQEEIYREIVKFCKELKYNFIIVPFMSIKERADFILKNVFD